MNTSAATGAAGTPGAMPAPSFSSLQSAIVPVSGAASGIGLAICRQLRAVGATPLLLDVNSRSLEPAVREVFPELDAQGALRHAYAVDVADSAAVDACFERILREHGPATHAVSNAGIGVAQHILELTDAQWHRVIDVNLNGSLYFCRAAARQIAPARSGSIVVMASIAGLMAKGERAGYAASKAALINMARALAIDLGDHGVRVNAVAPGIIDTPMQVNNQLAARADRSLLHRRGTAGEIAHATLFLLSDLASYVTGHTLVVDGGVTASYA